MGSVVVIGERSRVGCYALAGARVLAAEDADDVAEAWARVPAGTTVVVLTAQAAAARAGLPPRPEVLQVVMDE